MADRPQRDVAGAGGGNPGIPGMAGNPEGSVGIGMFEGKGNGIGGSPGTVKTGGAVLGSASGVDASAGRGFVVGRAVVGVTGVAIG